MILKELFKRSVLSLLFFSSVGYCAVDEPEWRVLVGAESWHAPDPDYPTWVFNENHNPIGVYKNVEVFDAIDNEYVGIVEFTNSYYRDSVAISYEGGFNVTDNLIAGGRVLVMNGYEREDNSGNVFITDEVALAIQPFVRYEQPITEEVGAFVEGTIIGAKASLLTFGLTF